jgi:hypothetical protein
MLQVALFQVLCTFLHEQIFEGKNDRINFYKALNRHFLKQIVEFRIHTKVYKVTEMTNCNRKAT